MRVVAPPPTDHRQTSNSKASSAAADSPNSANSMSQGLHQGILSFSNGFDRSTALHNQEEQHLQHVAQQSRSDKLRVQGLEPPPPLVVLEEEDSGELPVVYDQTGAAMWSEMFNFPGGATGAATELLRNEIPSNYGLSRPPAAAANEWYGSRQGMLVGGRLGPLGDSKHSNNSDSRDSSHIAAQNHQISSINADSAAAMQLFLMNPQPRSPSPAPHHPQSSTTTPLHLLLSNQSTSSSNPPLQLQAYHHHSAVSAFNNSNQTPPSPFAQVLNSSSTSKIAESQGLSLTLSSSLQHLEAAKAEEYRMGDDGMLYYDQRSSGQLKNLGNHLQGLMGQTTNDHVIGFRSSTLGMINLLRNSRYVKAARELLEEFCSVGRGDLKNNRLGRQNTNLSSNQNGGSSPSSKNLPPLSAADRNDYQRKKTKLLSMLEEVDRRYNHYCEQMQTVVNSFDSVMGFGAAILYTGLAQKAMSRHFRCLKDAIVAQLKLTYELLGEKDSSAGASGVTKGETPRLKLLEQSLRQQRAFHQMGMMEQEAWRPQRGLPERSVNILRAWLFEHFLHPYPSDADKHLLSRQTGLSRNQVSNWFINARVRLWKPMVEEMYQKEAKEEEVEEEEEEERDRSDGQSNSSTRTPTPAEAVTAPTSTMGAGKRRQAMIINASESDPSFHAVNANSNRQSLSENQAITITQPASSPARHVDVVSPETLDPDGHVHHQMPLDDACLHGSVVPADYRTTTLANANSASTLVSFRTITGDVSLTLGLRPDGNLAEIKNRFSVRDFGDC